MDDKNIVEQPIGNGLPPEEQANAVAEAPRETKPGDVGTTNDDAMPEVTQKDVTPAVGEETAGQVPAVEKNQLEVPEISHQSERIGV